MKNSSLIIKVASIFVAGVMIVSFILPKFDEIQVIQNDIATRQKQLDNVNQVNAQLQSKINEINAISVADQTALLTFLPDSIDSITVMRTLQNLAMTSGLNLQSLDYGGLTKTDGSNLTEHSFSLSAVGSYEAVTEFFSLIEQNDYLLEFTEVDLSVDETGEILLDASFVTYTLLEEPEELN